MGLTETQALKLSCSMGGGISGLREICGAFTGLCMALGALKGYASPDDQQAKERHYAMIQEKAARFHAEYGTLICRDLLAQQGIAATPKPAVRTAEYYRDRPCSKYVETCARMVQEELAK
jgi:C_GCAxxG_C_C family probable redox protein